MDTETRIRWTRHYLASLHERQRKRATQNQYAAWLHLAIAFTLFLAILIGGLSPILVLVGLFHMGIAYTIHERIGLEWEGLEDAIQQYNDLIEALNS